MSRQVMQTRNNIIKAFWQLYRENEINKITVGNIVKLAQHNRGTFYKYFLDIYDLLDQVEDELLQEISKEFQTVFAAGVPDTLEEYSKQSALVFKKYQDRLFLLLGPAGDAKFSSKLQKIFFEMFTETFKMDKELPHRDYLAVFMCSSLVGLLTHWYEKNTDLSEEEFVGLLQRLLANGTLGYLHQSPFKN